VTHSVPWVTAALSGAVVALFVVAGAPEALMLGGSGPWRWLTAHAVHLSVDHLLYDALAFAVLGTVVELRSRTSLLAVLLVAALAVSGYAAWALPTGASYGGLSGIDAALTAAVVVQLLESPDRRPGALLGLAFGAKLLLEQTSGGALLAEGLHLPAVHLVGAAAGAAVAAVGSRLQRPT
jgi:rhomboid family GlyGly-CTERM serine protease